MAQLQLFTEAQPVSTTPSADMVRPRIETILATLRAADNMPWTESEARYWSVVVPQMANWLPTEERDAVRAEFAAEMKRLQAAEAA